MKYTPIHNDFLTKEWFDLVYIMTGDINQKIYKTVTNGLIGLGIILEGNAQINNGNGWEKIPPFSIFGMTNKLCQIQLSEDYKEISIGFKPYFFNLFVKEKLSLFTKGKITDASLIFDKYHLEQLAGKVRNARDEQQIITAAAQFFQKQYLPFKENPRVLQAVQMIYQQETNKVQYIANKLSISPTTLRNEFKEHIGLSPKELIKITRTYKALQLPKNFPNNLTQLSYELGYFDQAHFIKEFKKTVGISPKKYFENKNLTFDFYNYGRWISDNFALK